MENPDITKTEGADTNASLSSSTQEEYQKSFLKNTINSLYRWWSTSETKKPKPLDEPLDEDFVVLPGKAENPLREFVEYVHLNVERGFSFSSFKNKLDPSLLEQVVALSKIRIDALDNTSAEQFFNSLDKKQKSACIEYFRDIFENREHEEWNYGWYAWFLKNRKVKPISISSQTRLE